MHQSPFYGIFPDTMKYIFKEILKKFLLTTRTFFFSHNSRIQNQVPTDCKLEILEHIQGLKQRYKKIHGLKILKSYRVSSLIAVEFLQLELNCLPY